MGHLMTAACLHYRLTGKRNLLDVAIKATDFLCNFYNRASEELARNTICPSHYMSVVEISQKWKKGDLIELILPMEAQLVDAHPLVEKVHNQVAVKRGPVVYCIESADIPADRQIFDYVIPANTHFKPKTISISDNKLCALEGNVKLIPDESLKSHLYRPVNQKDETVSLQMIPCYTWGNRVKGDMSVWLPVRK
jgi:DUF1680 family protein